MMVEFIILLKYQQDRINNMYTGRQGPAHNDTDLSLDYRILLFLVFNVTELSSFNLQNEVASVLKTLHNHCLTSEILDIIFRYN